MSLPDTAQYWWDIKSRSNKKVFVHIKGIDCGHYHVTESDELDDIDCRACKKIIEQDVDLKNTLTQNNGKRERRYEAKRKQKKGYKLDSTIKFGKYKSESRSIQWIIENDAKYFDWLSKGVMLLHPEVDDFVEKQKNT